MALINFDCTKSTTKLSFAGEKKHLPRKIIFLNHGYDVINIAAYKNNHVCIVRKLTVSRWTRTKINSGFLPLALSLYHADIPVSTWFSAFFFVCFLGEARELYDTRINYSCSRQARKVVWRLPSVLIISYLSW